MTKNSKATPNVYFSFSLDFIGLTLWIIFMILWYGTGTFNPSNFNIFWVWFPLWAPLAFDLAIIILCWVIGLLLVLFNSYIDRYDDED